MLDIDRDRQRISLGLKQTQEDPWQTVLNSYGPGSSLSGKVTKVVAFGAFVEIVPGVEGLVHISELAEHHVETPGEVVQPGEEVRVKILEIDEERRRISLSIKRVGEGGLPLRDAFQAAQAGHRAGDGAEPSSGSPRKSSRGAAGGLEITDEDLAAAHAAVEAEAAAAQPSRRRGEPSSREAEAAAERRAAEEPQPRRPPAEPSGRAESRRRAATLAEDAATEDAEAETPTSRAPKPTTPTPSRGGRRLLRTCPVLR